MVKRLLVVKLADVGDLLTATAALRSLRIRFPTAHIDVLSPPHAAEALRGLDSIDDVLLFQKAIFDSLRTAAAPGSLVAAAMLARRLRREHYDAVLVFHHLVTRWGALKYAALALATGAPRRIGLDNGLGRSWFLTDRAPDGGFGAAHEADYWLRVADLLGGRLTPAAACQRPAQPRLDLEISIPSADRLVADKLLGSTDRPTIAIHPGSGSFSLARRWPSRCYADVANSLVERAGARVVLVGGPDEAELCAEVAQALRQPTLSLAGRTTLKQLSAVLSRCDLFVGNDSGLTHVAAAAGTKVVAVFGLSNHRAWGPYGSRDWPLAPGEIARRVVVRADLPCSPCLYRGHSLGNRFGCATRDCLRLVTPETVTAAALHILGA